MTNNCIIISNYILVASIIISLSYSIFLKLKNTILKDEINVLNTDLHENERIINELIRKIDTLRIKQHENHKKDTFIRELVRKEQYVEVLNFINMYTDIPSDTSLDSNTSTIDNIINPVKTDCMKNDIDFKTYIGDLHLNIPIEPNNLNSIITNILENSVRILKEDLDNNPDKKVYIRMNIYDDSIGYFIEIINNGPKITNTDDIFKKGYTSTNNPERGLGLYICKNLVEKYDGKIYVESNNVNTKFSIVFPKH